MLIQRKSLLIILLFIASSTFAQKRIGVDLSTRMDNLMLTFNYQQVIKNRLLFSTGIYYGGHGHQLVENDSIRLYGGEPIRTPYENSSRPIEEVTNTYSVLDYVSSAKSIVVQVGLGFYHPFGVMHGLRANLHAKIGFAQTEVYGYYRSIQDFREVRRTHYANHFVGGLSMELYHTIRLTGRMTFYYGAKVPYYFTLDKARFDPSSNKDLLSGFEPELAIGLTRVIGKCN